MIATNNNMNTTHNNTTTGGAPPATPVKKYTNPKYDRTYGDVLLKQVSQKLRDDRILCKKGKKTPSGSHVRALRKILMDESS